MTEERSTFIEVFGDSPLIRVLDFFLTFRDFDYPLIEISKNSGVAWSTLHQLFPKLIKQEIVRKTREIGRAKLYMLNKENPITQQLIEMDNRIMRYFADLDTSEAVPVRISKKK
jgi:DNA-binding IclR family transcriptional regulator